MEFKRNVKHLTCQRHRRKSVLCQLPQHQRIGGADQGEHELLEGDRKHDGQQLRKEIIRRRFTFYFPELKFHGILSPTMKAGPAPLTWYKFLNIIIRRNIEDFYQKPARFNNNPAR